MYVKISYDRKVNGFDYKAGEVYEVDNDTAAELINRGLGVKTRKPAKREPEKVPDSKNEGENN